METTRLISYGTMEKVSKASITSKNAGNLTVKYNGKQKALNFKAGETKLIK